MERRYFNNIPKNVLIVGDIMLDRYISGKQVRRSQEAKGFIFDQEEAFECLGGASNVAINILPFVQKVSLMGMLGADWQGNSVQQLLKESGISSDLFVLKEKTHYKQRFYLSDKMIFRVDRDSDERLTTRELEFLSAKLTPLHFDAIVVSDYAKGMVTQELYDMLIDFAILHKIPVFVDPHPQSKVNYRGCLYLVPNMLEALALVCASLSDKNSLEKLTSKLSAKYYSSIIITDGANGAYVFQKDERYVEHVPGRKIKSNNVCGAGDTFLAAFVYATLAGYPCRDSVQIANAAASIVATKPGTATITLEELNRILEL